MVDRDVYSVYSFLALVWPHWMWRSPNRRFWYSVSVTSLCMWRQRRDKHAEPPCGHEPNIYFLIPDSTLCKSRSKIQLHIKLRNTYDYISACGICVTVLDVMSFGWMKASDRITNFLFWTSHGWMGGPEPPQKKSEYWITPVSLALSDQWQDVQPDTHLLYSPLLSPEVLCLSRKPEKAVSV